MSDNSTPAIMKRRDFARHIDRKPGYVTQLANAGRLVLAANGRDVMVAESIARIAETRDPSKAGVAARHAEARGRAPQPPADTTEPPGADKPAADEAAANPRYQDARAKREHYLAMAAERDYRISIGELIDATEARAVIRDAITGLRTAFESLPAKMRAQSAAETDEARNEAMWVEVIEHALGECSRRFAELATTKEHST